MVDDTKIGRNIPEGQAETQLPRALQIERELLKREMQRIRDQIAPHMVAIVKAFRHPKPESESAGRIGAAIGRLIGHGIAGYSTFDDDSVFGAEHLEKQIGEGDVARITANLVADFLKRVDEIGEIAEDASLRNEQ